MLPLLSFLVGLRPHALECQGCVDDSIPPSTQTMQTGTCIAYTTVQFAPHGGNCFAFGELCMTSPCTPWIQINNHSQSSLGCLIEGRMGGLFYGPVRFDSGSTTVLFQGYTEMKCGSNMGYFFYVTTHCPGSADQIEYISGEFECSSCLPQ
jgi:hypothetical protein